jgi:hypothetical protein
MLKKERTTMKKYNYIFGRRKVNGHVLTNLCLSSSASLSACSRANRLRSASAALASSSVLIRIFAIIDAEIMKSYVHRMQPISMN